jgi:hypothetical protein
MYMLGLTLIVLLVEMYPRNIHVYAWFNFIHVCSWDTSQPTTQLKLNQAYTCMFLGYISTNNTIKIKPSIYMYVPGIHLNQQHN